MIYKKNWVKTSLAPGSKVVSDYLDQSGLTKYLIRLGLTRLVMDVQLVLEILVH